MFTREHLDTPLDFDAAVKAGSMNGTSALMIFDEDDCVVRAVKKWSEFYEHESCGKCTPCREGTYWYVGIYERLEARHATAEDLDTLLDLSDNILGRSFCALGDGADQPGVVLDQVLPRRVPGARRRARLPVRAATSGARTLAGAH